MVLVQKWPFFKLFFLGNIGQDNVFYDILEGKKTPFYAIKKKKKTSLKSREINIFPIGLTHGFGQKIGNFFYLFFFFSQYRPGKCVLRSSRT